MANRVKQRLADGNVVTLVNVDHVSPSLVESLGRIPVDAVFFDCEQGAPDFLAVEDMARAARLTGLTSVVRIYAPEDWLVERCMFRGVDGIVVPRIDTPDEAARMVRAMQYCYPNNHDEKIVIVQIESAAALDNLSAILAVDGIDAFFIGPVDLAKSLGHAGDYRVPAMQQVIDETIARIRDAGKAPGMMVDRETVRRYQNLGVQLLYEHANNFLRYGVEAFTEATTEPNAGT
jgi:2-keto-3-deoxy-L-rhamnonate aldolase RhmA